LLTHDWAHTVVAKLLSHGAGWLLLKTLSRGLEHNLL
jgi:hypothetical protein